MKLREVLVGQVIMFIRLQEPIGGIYVPEFVKAVQEQYKFVTVPKTMAEFDRAKGVKFEHGYFLLGERKIVLDRVDIFNNGISVSTRTHTEDVDQFLDSVIEWGTKVIGMREDMSSPREKLFLSNLEVELRNPLSVRSKLSDTVSKALGKHLPDYGLKTRQYENIGMAMHFEVLGLSAPIPTNFKLERREGQEFEKNIFFSSAPLKTKDHLALLEQIEALA